MFVIFAKRPFLMTNQIHVSFENTEAAFSSRSDHDLTRAYRLFSVMNNKFIVKLGIIFINAAIALHLPIFYFVKKTIFKHFCGGESIDDSEKAIAGLHRFGIGAILDYAVEGGGREEDFEKTSHEIIKTIVKAGKTPAIPFSVFKPSGIASKDLLTKIQARQELGEEEKLSFQRIKDRFLRICETANRHNVRLFIDSEDSWYQNAVDDIVEEMMQKFNQEQAIVFNTYQMYRRDMPERLRMAFRRAERENYFLGAKLVRGAYMEKERKHAMEMNYDDPIFPDKPATDRAFNDALDFCVNNISRISVCCGSHNEESSMRLVCRMGDYGLTNNDQRVYFAQLYGMSDHISYNLAFAGYNVAKYVPYGPVKAVIPYLTRRAEENTSIAGQSSRELQLIRKELERRQVLKKQTGGSRLF